MTDSDSHSSPTAVPAAARSADPPVHSAADHVVDHAGRHTVDRAYATFIARAADAGIDVPVRQQLGRIVVDLDAYEVAVDGVVIGLSPRQVEMLALFLAAPGMVWSRRALGSLCWGEAGASRRVDVQLCRIRGRLGLDLFRNTRDRGWSLRDDLLLAG